MASFKEFKQTAPEMESAGNTGRVIDELETGPIPEPSNYYVPTSNDEELIAFVIHHTNVWRDYRDQNFLDDWLRYERIWRGKWDASDKMRNSERSRVISPATQQAVETRHAEIMEAIFGQGEFFDIDAASYDTNSPIPIERLKAQLGDDFQQDKLRKSIDQIALLGEVYGTGIGEIVISENKVFHPSEMPLANGQVAYGVSEQTRVSVRLSPVNPKNFIFDPNGTEIDDCMGCAVERHVSLHKISQGIRSGKYLNVDITPTSSEEDLEEIQESKNFDNDKVVLLTYYGLVPKRFLSVQDESLVDLSDDIGADDDDAEEYKDMVEAIVIIANGGMLLKREESPYMMQDRPIISYQADTVPNRLLGRGTVEKALNMQSAIDGSMRSHMDSLALTVAPMMAIDATRMPRGAKYEVQPGKQIITNGNPNEILMPFAFGTNDGMAMNTSKEFERMLLMATGTIDSNGTVSQVARDSNMDMATATMIKKYKRTLVNFQEDFLIPFIYKAAWRYMQFDPQRYPSVKATFIPKGTLGIIAREYEQKQLAFMIQTLGAQSPLTPILMKGILHNSALPQREEMINQLDQAGQPDPQQQQFAMMEQQAQLAKLSKELEVMSADANKKNAEAMYAMAQANSEPDVAKAKLVAALSNNLETGDEDADFERRAKMADLMVKEKAIDVNHAVAQMQFIADMAKNEKSGNPKPPKTNDDNLVNYND